MIKTNISRRCFLKRATGIATGALAFPYIVSSSALGKDGNIAPSNRIIMGCIGTGWMGTDNLRSFLNEPDARIVAV